MIVVRFAVLLYLAAAFGGGEAAPPVQSDHAQLWAGAPVDPGDSQSSDDDSGDDDDDDAGPIHPDTSWAPSVMPALFAPLLVGRIIAASDVAPPSAIVEPLFRPPRALSA